ncbi:prolyl oligopeptidase family serine peptidase [Rhodococcus olei]|uniref:Prolyl oligopeptidase family serine peptidase n=1 Tax=Rhodococcus olei TaxID=2161675 RepID=A0ABP8NYZ7_9NOCA
MRRLRGVLPAAAVASALVVAAAAAGGSPALAAAPPPHGTVIGTAALPSAAHLPGAATQRRLTYWTEGPTGRPARSTGAVYLPPGPPPDGGWPVVSWAHGTTGVADACAPSAGDVSDATRDYLDAWLGAGFAVVATDYVGLGTEGVHAYLHGRSEGRAVVDMVRAATSVTPELARTWVVAGHSQGGHAAMFAAHEGTRYAPDLDYRGAIATGTPANLELLLPFGGPGFPNLGLNGLTVFAAYIVDGLRVSHPDLPIGDYLTPAGAALVDDSTTMCFTQLRDRVGDVGVGDMLARPLDEPRLRDAIRDHLAVPTSGYDRPVFVGHGVTDQTVPFPLGAKLAADLATNRQDVTFRAYPGAHGASAMQSLPDAIAFARAHL